MDFFHNLSHFSPWLLNKYHLIRFESVLGCFTLQSTMCTQCTIQCSIAIYTGLQATCVPEINESLGKISISTIFGQSRQISVSTTMKIVVSTKSRSRQFTNYESRTNLDLDNFGTLSLVPVSISTISKILISCQSRPRQFSDFLSRNQDF